MTNNSSQAKSKSIFSTTPMEIIEAANIPNATHVVFLRKQCTF